MKLFKYRDMIGGWMVGDFEPTAFKTKNFEVSYKIHKKGEVWDIHYHPFSTEINLLISGKMTMQNKTLKSGDIFVLEPYEIADPFFLTTCKIVCVKTTSRKDDKVIVSKI